MRAVGLGVLLSGCVLHHVETYSFEERSAAEVSEAARRAAQKLGWEADASARGRLRLLDVPHEGAFRTALEVFSEDGRLIIEGDRPVDAWRPSPLGPASRVLATETARELAAEVRESSPAVAPRSKLAAAALDVLFPAAGALYAGLGDPYLTSGATSWASHPWAQFGLRLALDASAGLFASTLVLRRGGPEPTWWEWALLAEMLVVNRVIALVFDLRAIGFRNAYAEGGLPSPHAPLLYPSSIASR